MTGTPARPVAGGSSRDTADDVLPLVVVYADESCLGNGREGDNPGGAGGLIEVMAPGGAGLVRRDYWISEPATTNNRMELLLFRLTGKLRYGINVFKVQEVIQCPSLTHIPNSHPVVCGIANIRGKTLSIIDLGAAIGQAALPSVAGRFVIIAEYNRSTIGFLVSGVDRIVNLTWGEIIPPPKASGKEHFLTAVTRVDDELVEILDVEKYWCKSWANAPASPRP